MNRPKPTAVHALHGFPGKRPPPPEEPKPDAADSIAAPAWLRGDAREIWNTLVPELHRLGLFTKLDVPMFAAACRWWAVYRVADRALTRRGVTHTSPSNGRQPAPELSIAFRAHDAAVNVFARYGVTPSDRTRLHAPQPKGHDDATRSTDPHDELARRRAARREPAAVADTATS